MSLIKSVPITLVTGYLGSGKTTLINYLLTHANGKKMAVIVNDIGEVNIDADLIEKGGVVTSKDDNLVALQNGCICCTLKEDLIKQLADLVNSHKFDHILIEASGICEPLPIAQTICYMREEFKKRNMPDFYHLDAIISVTDGLRLADEFGCGAALEEAERGEEDIENLIIQQIEFCNIIILNKISMLTPDQIDKVKKTIKALQPSAEIIDADYCEVSIDRLVDTDLFDFDKVAGSATWIAEFENQDNEVEDHGEHDDDDDHDHEHHHDHDDDDDDHDHEHEHGHEHHHHHHHHHEHGVDHNDDESTAEEYGVGTYVYFRRKPLNRALFEQWAQTDFGRQIIRAKGIVYFLGDEDNAYVYESAGKQRTLTTWGQWYAATLTKQQIAYYLDNDPEFKKGWDATYGDRMIKLVFIGQNIDKKKIREALDQF